MRKFTLIALALALLFAVGANAEGILPVLQTPPPEITETISWHRVFNYGSTPSASTTSDGCYYYTYDPVPYASYQKFGQALAQEGYALSGIEAGEDTCEFDAICTKGTTTLTLRYNPHYRKLTVTYSPRVLAEEANAEVPYVIDESQTSILPELPQVISLHAITGLDRPYDVNKVEDGYQYSYYGVPYAAYARFSVKLGEAGFSLVSSEKTEEGYDRAVVTDGQTQLTIDYDQESEYAYITYPMHAFPRDRSLDDCEPVAEGDTVQTLENVSVTFGGWEFVDRYYSGYNGARYNIEEGGKIVLIHMDVDFYRPESFYVGDILRDRTVYVGDDTIDTFNFGGYKYDPEDPDLHNVYDKGNSVTGKAQFSAAIAIRLTDEQAANPEDIAFTFCSMDYATPYVYRLR